MPITSRHPDFLENEEDWELCADFAQGSRPVKKKGLRYLPRPTGMTPDEYGAFKDRASFLNAMGRTVSGLSGAMTRVPATATLSPALEYLHQDATGTGRTLQECIRGALKGVMTTGRRGVLVDSDNLSPSRPRLILYTEMNITNWQIFEGQLNLVVLRSIEWVQDPKDEYELIEVEVYQELFINDAGAFTYRFWRPENIGAREPVYVPSSPVTPLSGSGQPLDYIPFVFLSPVGTDATPVKPPLLDLCNLNRSHYLNSADLEHGRHLVSLPTPWVSGVNPKDYEKGLKIGSAIAWILSSADAKVGMLEFTGRGLGHLADAIDEKQQQMALMGAKLLQPQRKQVESAELARMANAGDASILMGIVLAVGEGLSRALEYCADIINVSAQPSLVMNTDFIDIKLAPDEMTTLFNLYLEGVYSEEDLIRELTLGERFKGDAAEAVVRLKARQEEREADADGEESDTDDTVQSVVQGSARA